MVRGLPHENSQRPWDRDFMSKLQWLSILFFVSTWKCYTKHNYVCTIFLKKIYIHTCVQWVKLG